MAERYDLGSGFAGKKNVTVFLVVLSAPNEGNSSVCT